MDSHEADLPDLRWMVGFILAGVASLSGACN
jgi:hypothetical protein